VTPVLTAETTFRPTCCSAWRTAAELGSVAYVAFAKITSQRTYQWHFKDKNCTSDLSIFLN